MTPRDAPRDGGGAPRDAGVTPRDAAGPRRATVQAPAKLNLGLRVVGRRDDGYHELDSLFVPIDLADEVVVEVAPADAPDATLVVDGCTFRAGEDHGIHLTGSTSATITDSDIYGVTSDGGGGITVDGSTATITGCRIFSNQGPGSPTLFTTQLA